MSWRVAFERTRMLTWVSRLWGGGSAGQFVFATFVGMGRYWANACNSGGDEGFHVFERVFVFASLPRLAVATDSEIVRVVAVQRTPDGDQACLKATPRRPATKTNTKHRGKHRTPVAVDRSIPEIVCNPLNNPPARFRALGVDYPPAHEVKIRTSDRLYCTLVDEHRTAALAATELSAAEHQLAAEINLLRAQLISFAGIQVDFQAVQRHDGIGWLRAARRSSPGCAYQHPRSADACDRPPWCLVAAPLLGGCPGKIGRPHFYCGPAHRAPHQIRLSADTRYASPTATFTHGGGK